MFRPASRVIRASASSTSFRATPRAATQRRLLSTAPPAQKKRGWKSFALRLGAVGGIIYWYNTNNVFADEPAYVHPSLPSTDHESETLPTLDSIAASRRKQQLSEPPQSQSSSPSTTAPAAAETVKSAGDGEVPLAGSPEELEEEADQQGAFNPETGEINWDCPCLGGMAHGPCGEQFKAAFSCFVYSKEEPKGVDCIEHFKTMQNCFRDHPDVYGSELDDDDEDSMDEPGEGEGEGEKQPAIRDGGPAVNATGDNVPDDKLHGEKVAHAKPGKTGLEQEVNARRERAKTATEQVKREHEPQSEVDEAVPKAWHDQSDANNKVKK